MSKVIDKELLEKAKLKAKELLEDEKKFNDHFEETFKKYDTNNNGTIDLGEYVEFLTDLLNESGRKEFCIQMAALKFDYADKDRSGAIEKKEFKNELKNRLREIVNLK